MTKRYPHNLSHTETSTINMGTCVPTNIIEVFPGDSFNIQAKDLTRLLPQVAPTMHDVFIGIDTYQVPLRQIFDKLGLDWDAYLTGGEDGTTVVDLPQITIPEDGYEPGSLADFLGYPTNWTDPSTNEHHTGVAAGQKFSAIPVLVYMHIINENYRDQNFIKKLDFSKYQDFLDGVYQFYDASGNAINYDLQREGLFPKAWSRDYYGRAMPNTQRGAQATIPIGSSASLQPSQVAVSYGVNGFKVTNSPGNLMSLTAAHMTSMGIVNTDIKYYPYSQGSWEYTAQNAYDNLTHVVMFNLAKDTIYPYNTRALIGSIDERDGNNLSVGNWYIYATVDGSTKNVVLDFVLSGTYSGKSSLSGVDGNALLSGYYTGMTLPSVSLAGVTANLATATATSIIALRTAARMQQCGEWLQDAGARAVEFTMKFFGVRIPDGRVQRPIFHGSFRMPIVFSEVLQTSQTTDTSTLATLGGHGITGGVNKPIHIKVIEHGFIMSIMHVMPRSQFQNIIPKYLLRKTRWDMPNPLFQGIGEQALLRKEIYPESAHPDETFGYIPQFSELMSIPSTLHGHMKDTFLHWTMARVYTSEPVLSAAWRYEKPSDRSFAVQGEDQMQVCIGYVIKSRRVFKNNPRPGIHII